MSFDVNVLRKFAASWQNWAIVQRTVAQINQSLPDELKSNLPTIEEIDVELGGELG